MKKVLLVLFTVFLGLNLQAQATAYPPVDLEVCDDNNDGVWNWDLTITYAEILGGQNPVIFEVAYFLNFADADIGVNPITQPYNYQNIANPQTIYARVENTTNGDYDITSFDLTVHLSPVIPLNLPNLRVYDEDGDGFTVFNLRDEEPFILGDQDPLDFEVSYYISQIWSELMLFPIQNPTSYANVLPVYQEIYIGLLNVNTGCYSVWSFTIEADPNLEISQSNFNELQIYPNPVNEILKIKTQEQTEFVKIYSLSEFVLKECFNVQEIDVSDLKTGMYFIQLTIDEKTITKKFIKK